MFSADDGKRPEAVLVGVQLPSVSDDEHRSDLDELGRLSETLGLDVVGRVSQRRPRLRSGTVLGLGKLRELAAWTGGSGNPSFQPKRKNKLRDRRDREANDDVADEFEELDAPDEVAEADEDHGESEVIELPSEATGTAKVIVVDHELTPTQQRNLERATGAEVLDRTQVIVEIFHRHAKSREARLEVEIARLMYVAPRLREAGAGADRQRGGIGGKGAGESAVELDRRRIRDRIAELRHEIARIQGENAHRRAARRDQRRVALVGYTNAGKSSLMRALTGSEVYVADKLFATLDPTIRALKPETDPRILVSDTVGFIKKLPHELVASFRSTLDEALEASLLLYLVDSSDPAFRSQLEVTTSVLREIGADAVPSRIVLNKRDRLTPDQARALQREFPDALLVSAHDPHDVARVREALIEFFDGALSEAELFVPYARHGLVRKVHDAAVVLEERHDEDGTHLRVRGAARSLDRLRAILEAASATCNTRRAPRSARARPASRRRARRDPRRRACAGSEAAAWPRVAPTRAAPRDRRPRDRARSLSARALTTADGAGSTKPTARARQKPTARARQKADGAGSTSPPKSSRLARAARARIELGGTATVAMSSGARDALAPRAGRHDSRWAASRSAADRPRA
ncbi:MAG: GTPase HflX [Polyangiaceae bacterium]